MPFGLTRLSFEQISKGSSYGLVSLIPEKRRILDTSPVTLAKAVKNETEICGMRRAHVGLASVFPVTLVA